METLERKWLPTFADLIDRLSIHQLKEVFISEFKHKYRQEMSMMVHDLDLLCRQNNILLNGQIIRAIIILAQINEHIWYNESSVRSGKDQNLDLLKLTHGLNGIRNKVMNYMLALVGQEQRKDYKTDCLAAEFSNWDIALDLNE